MDDLVWSYRDATWIHERDLVGYSVEGEDGAIGTVSKASTATGEQWLVVHTGVWFLGHRRLMPAGTVVGVDHDGKLVVVNLTQDEVKAAPDYDDDTWDDDARSLHTDYYQRHASRD